MSNGTAPGGTAGWTGVTAGHPFGLHTLPYGVFTDAAREQPRVGVAVGDAILDLTAAAAALLPEHLGLFGGGSLDTLLAAGRRTWTAVRAALTEWLTDDRYADVLAPLLVPATGTTMRLPFTVADYVDFYSCEQHATNVGRILRPGQPPLPANWRHLPVGYHGRAGTVVGTPSIPGRPVPLTDFADHVFGVCLVNDWSARDIQAWEYLPLGPFLGKSFATSISPWVIPLDALAAARVRPPSRDPHPLPYLDDTRTEPWGLDITLEVRLNDQLVSRPPFAGMYWTAPQQLAHLTSNGARVRTGDLFASGTVSGAAPDQRGCLLELSWDGASPLTLEDGGTRSFLADGDEVSITATAPGPDGTTIGLGEVRGQVRGGVPAHVSA
jgi:fumarylacetoacetase